jgi:hypothetical protein
MSERTAAHLTGVTSTVQNASFPNTQPAGFVRLRSRTRHCDVRPRGLRCLPGISVLPAAPRSGSENRAGLKNVVQNLVQLRAERAPISPLGSSLLR